jgi:hypothetical protein
MTWQGEKEQREGKFSGIDRSKAPPCSLFYLPIRRAGAEASAWFRDFAGQPLDVMAWLSSKAVDEIEVGGGASREARPPEDDVPHAGCGSLAPWDKAMADMRTEELCAAYVGLGRGVQDRELYRLAWRLAVMGLPGDALRARLDACAASSHSAEDRLRQVNRIMADLARHGRA